jgi:hypothetical protein
LSMTLILLRFHWPPMIRNSWDGEPVTALVTGVVLLTGLVLIGHKLNGLSGSRLTWIKKSEVSTWRAHGHRLE